MKEIYFVEESVDCLEDYKSLSIGFKVESVFDIEQINNGLGGVAFVERQVEPYWLNHDTEDSNPIVWPRKWDLSKWYILSAYHDEKRVGGAIVAFNTDGVNMLEGRSDITALWDLRVDVAYRGQGVGRKLVEHCIRWTQEKQCKRLKIETQNTNVKACRFYKSIGAEISNINKFAYLDESDEIQIIWSIDIDGN